MKTEAKTSRYSSLQNALRVLKSFSVEEPELGVSQLAEMLGLGKSTVHRLLTTLAKEGFVVKDPKTNLYRLSARILHLGNVVISQYKFHRFAQPILQKLVNNTGETAHIGVLNDIHVVYLYKVECKHPVRLLSYIGKTNPAFCTSSGQAIIAYKPSAAEKIIAQGLKPYTSKTPATPRELRAKLAEIRKTGIAISIEELHEGVTSIAAPVWDDQKNEVIASVNIAGPIQRITNDKIPVLAKHVQQAAAELSQKMKTLT